MADTQHTPTARRRSNVPGSFHAKQLMGELRARKARLKTQELGRQYRELRGVKTSDEIRAALKADGFQWGVWSETEKQDWYRATLAKAKVTA